MWNKAREKKDHSGHGEQDVIVIVRVPETSLNLKWIFLFLR